LVSLDKRPEGYAVLSLNKEPVNSMDLQLWEQLYAAINTAEQDPEIRGIIFTSGVKKTVFTAGLDLKELHAPSTSEERLFTFWRALTKTLIAVYSSSLITIAAIPGACPAGGCCLALCCDYRIIAANGSMGLNEVAIGIPVPTYWIKLMASVVGTRQADYILQTGQQTPAEGLLAMGMVDQVLPTRDETMQSAQKEMAKWLRLPDAGRIETKTGKGGLRDALAEEWKAGTETEAATVWRCISKPETSDFLGMVMAKLSGKKKSKL